MEGRYSYGLDVLVSGGVLKQSRIRELFLDVPSGLPEYSGSRNSIVRHSGFCDRFIQIW